MAPPGTGQQKLCDVTPFVFIWYSLTVDTVTVEQVRTKPCHCSI